MTEPRTVTITAAEVRTGDVVWLASRSWHVLGVEPSTAIPGGVTLDLERSFRQAFPAGHLITVSNPRALR